MKKYFTHDLCDEPAIGFGKAETVYLAPDVDEHLATVGTSTQGLLNRIAELEHQLAYANDAAAKGELARMHAGGMEMRISELERICRIAYDDGMQGGAPLKATTLALLKSCL